MTEPIIGLIVGISLGIYLLYTLIPRKILNGLPENLRT
jgi:hypothetical protein